MAALRALHPDREARGYSQKQLIRAMRIFRAYPALRRPQLDYPRNIAAPAGLIGGHASSPVFFEAPGRPPSLPPIRGLS